MFIDMKHILPKVIKRAGISRQMDSVNTLEAYSKAVGCLLPEELASKVRPLYLKDGTLTVASLSAVAVQELRVREADILRELNPDADKPAVKRLKYLS
jgi:predicted nucleic acid-binding Zn ribbon protein